MGRGASVRFDLATGVREVEDLPDYTADEIAMLRRNNVCAVASSSRSASLDRCMAVPVQDAEIDADIMSAAIAEAQATGKRLSLGPGVWHVHGIAISGAISITGVGRSTVLRVRNAPGMPNTPLTVASNLGEPVGTWTGDISANDRSWTIAGTGLVPGDQVFVRFGIDPYDSTQPVFRMFNSVETVVGNVVTLRIGVPESIPDPYPIGVHQIFRPISIAENVTIENLSFDYADGAVCDQLIEIKDARNVKICNVFGVRTAGEILVVNSENVTVDGIYLQRGDRSVHQTSGRAMGAWGCRNLVVRNLFAQDVDGVCVFLESQNRGVLIENAVLQSGAGADSATPVMVFAGRSLGVIVRNLRINSTVRRPVISATQESQFRTEDVFLENGCQALLLERHSGLLSWNGKIYWRRRSVSRRIAIPTASGVYRYPIAEGVWLSARALLSDVSGLLWCEIGGNILESVVPGIALQIPKGVGPAYPDNKTSTDAKEIIIQTDGSGANGQWLLVEVDLLQADDNAAVMSDFES